MAADDATAPPDLGVVAEVPENGHAAKPAPEEPTPETSQQARAEAALDEGSDKTVVYRIRDRELKLHLAPKLKASVMYRAGILRDDDGAGAARLAQATLGDEQFDQVLDEMDAAGLTIEDEEAMTSLGNLLNAALATYGVTPGESQASPKS
jgi:hypothetical protein